MRFPVLVNMNLHTVDIMTGKIVCTDINRTVQDLYYKNIYNFSNGGKENTLVHFSDGRVLDLQISFDEFYDLYNFQNPIDERFKEIVESYKKDNLMHFLKDDKQ